MCTTFYLGVRQKTKFPWIIMTAPFHYNLMAMLMTLLLLSALTEAKISLTPTEEECLKQTGNLFAGNNELIAARHNYATSMKTEMTSSLTMTAKYPDDKLREYDAVCGVNGGFLHTIKIDFFDCKLGNMQKDVELTLKNFANCLADSEECMNFDQENLLEEAWEDLGLHCELEEGPGGQPLDPLARDDDAAIVVDDDLAHKEEKAASEGADDVDRTEKASEYISKEEQGKRKKKKGGAGKFFRNVLLLGIVGTAGYMIYDRKFNSRRLPWGGVTTSRFQQRGEGPTGFVSNYHMLSGDDEINFATGEHELQLRQV
jgi:hypothetical protein